MIKLALALLVLAQEGPNDAQSEPPADARSVALERVFPFWQDYQALPSDERDAFNLAYSFTLSRPGDAGFWVDLAGEYEALWIDESGLVTPPSEADFEAGRLLTDAPEGGVTVSMHLSLAAEPSERYELVQLESALAQAQNALRETMGIRSLFMASLETVQFEFDGAAPEAFLIFDNGDRREIETVAENIVTVRPGDRRLRGATAIEFGRPPITTRLSTRN